jgi:agmatine/peptidylarginine deiminase
VNVKFVEARLDDDQIDEDSSSQVVMVEGAREIVLGGGSVHCIPSRR